MKKTLITILLASSLLSGVSFYFYPKVGLGLQNIGTVNPTIGIGSIRGLFIGIGASNWAIGPDVTFVNIDQYNDAFAGTIDFKINIKNIIFSGGAFGVLETRRSSIVPDCEVYKDYRETEKQYDGIHCQNNTLGEKFVPQPAYKIGIGYKIEILDYLSIIPKYETIFASYEDQYNAFSPQKPHKSCLTSPKKDQLLIFLLDKFYSFNKTLIR